MFGAGRAPGTGVGLGSAADRKPRRENTSQAGARPCRGCGTDPVLGKGRTRSTIGKTDEEGEEGLSSWGPATTPPGQPGVWATGWGWAPGTPFTSVNSPVRPQHGVLTCMVCQELVR